MSKNNQKIISPTLISEIKEALESVKYGSIEIFVQNRVVTQITVRNIHKTSVEIEPEGHSIHVATGTQSKSATIRNNIYLRKDSVKVARE